MKLFARVGGCSCGTIVQQHHEMGPLLQPSLRSGHRAATRRALWKSSTPGRCLPSRGYSEHRAAIGCGDPPSCLRSHLCNSKTASSSDRRHTATREGNGRRPGWRNKESGVKQRCKSKQRIEGCATRRFTSFSAVPVALAVGGQDPWSTIIAVRRHRLSASVATEQSGAVSDLSILERCWLGKRKTK